MMMVETVEVAAPSLSHAVLPHVDHLVVSQLTLDVPNVEELGDAGKGSDVRSGGHNAIF
jgi:hypothetical protein